MNAATKRATSSSFAGLDPDARAIAYEAAQRAGLSVEEWIAQAIVERSAFEAPPRPAPTAPRGPARHAPSAEDLEVAIERLARAQAQTNRDLDFQRPPPRRADDRLARTASALDTVTRLIEKADQRIDQEKRRASEKQERNAAILSDALQRITQRIEHLESNVVEAQRASSAAAAAAVERLEQQIAQSIEARRREEEARVEQMLGNVEARIAEIGARIEQRIAEPTVADEPPAPMPAVEEERSDPLTRAIAQIRARQAELSGRPAGFTERSGDAVVAGLRADLERWTERSERAARERFASDDLRGLAEQIQRIDQRLAPMDPGEIASMRDGIDEVRRTVGQLAAEGIVPTRDLTERLSTLEKKLDSIGERAAQNDLSALSRQIDGMSEKLARVQEPPAALIETHMRDIAQRLDRLDQNLKTPIVPDLSTVERSLHTLAERLDQAERPDAGSAALDALERQVAALASKLDRTAEEDPAIASLERAMGDLMHQVESLRTEAISRPSSPTGDFGRDIAEIKAYQNAAERRMQETLESVHAALEKVGQRLTVMDLPQIPAAPPASEAARRDPRGIEEILLEPGSARPRHRPGPAAPPPAAEPDAQDVKASFIAAARRAAQAASEAAATPAPGPGAPKAVASGSARPGFASRLASGLAERRRPILLGLGAIVLALLTLQAANQFRSGSLGGSGKATVERTAPPPATEPKTTQSIIAAAPRPAPLVSAPEPAPAPRIDPPPSAAASLSPEPLAPPPATRILGITVADLPANLAPAGLRSAALGGDVAAVYEVASRTAEGRGVIRDLKLAAKLFEKAASAGFAPAQYRLGSQYEKGLGVTRDLAAAREWYARAADRGNARAMHNLAVLVAEGAGGKPDYAGAVDWFRKAAEFGVRDSQYNLAVLLARGMGTQQDLPGSYRWFAAAAAQGDDDAAKKRDEIASKLSPADLAAAKAEAERFRAKTPDQTANEVPSPPQGWGEAARAAFGKRA